MPRRQESKLCAVCGEPILFYSVKKGRRRRDRQHDLCARCWRRADDKYNNTYKWRADIDRWSRAFWIEERGDTIMENDVFFSLTFPVDGEKQDLLELEVGEAQKRIDLINENITYTVRRIA